jgi:iron complex transport system substrate-binding protein
MGSLKNAFASLLLLAFLLPGCWAGGKAEPPTAPVTAGDYRVTDALGRTVTFQKVPERIVLAGRAVVFTVNAAFLYPEARERIVGIGSTDQGLGDFYPLLDPRAGQKTRFDNSAGPEQLAAVRPDLVILKSFMKERLGDALESIGIPVLYVDLESPAAFASDIRMLGDLFQDPARAAFVNRYYEARVDAIKKTTADAPRPRALVVQHNERDGAAAFSVPPVGWIQTLVVEAAGGEPVWKTAGIGTGWNKVSFEQVAAWQPQVVLLISYQKPAAQVVEALRGSGNWKARLAAFPADFYSWDQPDTRWILGLEWVARTLHPELFADMDLKKEVSSFYRELYGMDQAVIDAEILPRLEGALAAK